MPASSQVKDGKLTVTFTGEIDETLKFRDIEVPAGARSLVFDMKDVRVINSGGLRAWVLWVRALPPGTSVSFRNCPTSVVSQMNMVGGFFPKGATVESFFVPYYCEKCETETLRLVQRERDFTEGTSQRPEELRIPNSDQCPNCQSTMQWDIVPEIYFRFLKYRS